MVDDFERDFTESQAQHSMPDVLRVVSPTDSAQSLMTIWIWGTSHPLSASDNAVCQMLTRVATRRPPRRH